MSISNKSRFLLDSTTFTAVLILMNPHSSGIAIHEWLAIALAATVVIHLLTNWTWIAEKTKRIFASGLNGSRFNYILNWTLFIDGILIMLSGIMVSQAVVPTLGLTLPASFTWRELHEFSTNFSMLLIGIHLALHWNWIVSVFKRLFTSNTSEVSSMNRTLGKKDAQA